MTGGDNINDFIRRTIESGRNGYRQPNGGRSRNDISSRRPSLVGKDANEMKNNTLDGRVDVLEGKKIKRRLVVVPSKETTVLLY